jgi:hypothetical protein
LSIANSATFSLAAWKPHKDVFEEDALVARRKHSVTPQASNLTAVRPTGDSIVTILHVAPQLGQLKGIGSKLFMGDGKEAGIKRNKCPREWLIMYSTRKRSTAKTWPLLAHLGQ